MMRGLLHILAVLSFLGFLAVSLHTDQRGWWKVLMLFLPAVAIAVNLWRGRELLTEMKQERHRKTGRCPSCGYDLRATQERCPECGLEVPPGC